MGKLRPGKKKELGAGKNLLAVFSAFQRRWLYKAPFRRCKDEKGAKKRWSRCLCIPFEAYKPRKLRRGSTFEEEQGTANGKYFIPYYFVVPVFIDLVLSFLRQFLFLILSFWFVLIDREICEGKTEGSHCTREYRRCHSLARFYFRPFYKQWGGKQSCLKTGIEYPANSFTCHK